MKNINKRSLIYILLIVVFILLIITSFILFSLYNAKDNSSRDILTKKGEYVIYGEYSEGKMKYTFEGYLPNPCYSYTLDYSIAESYPEQVFFVLNIVSPPSDSICIQVIKEIKEEGEIAVSKNATYNLNVTNE